MEDSQPQIVLGDEFRSLLQEVTALETPFTCLGVTGGGVRCTRHLAENRKTLSTIIRHILESLNKTSNEIEKLLKDASRLVMCTRSHQNQAPGKFEAWLKLVPNRNFSRSQNQDEAEQSISTVISELPKDNLFSAVLPDGLKKKATEAEVNSNPQVDDQSSSSGVLQSPFSPTSPSLEDSGFWIEGDEESINGAESSTKLMSSNLSSVKEFVDLITPQKPLPQLSTDSGISMTFNPSDDGRTTIEIKGSEDEPPSPLAGKRTRGQRAAAEALPIRPGPNPLQHGRTQAKRIFVPFDDTLKRLKMYLKKPLTKMCMEDGYIYGFQKDGSAYTKIGYVTHRSKDSSLEDSLEARMDEHRRDGCQNLKVVLKKPVPHAFRVEKIIHLHLESGRLKEQCHYLHSDLGKCDHKTHIEWFNTSLDEIYTIVIAWQHWILKRPYVEIGGVFELAPEWEEKVNNIPIKTPGDHWLQWLCFHVPDLPRQIKIAVVDTSSMIEVWTRVEKIENSPSASDDRPDEANEVEDGKTASPNTEPLSSTLVFRLRSSNTWPRKQTLAHE